MSTITRQQAQQIIEAADAVITALAGTNEDVHPDNSTKMVQLYDDLNDHYAPPEVVRELARIALASLEAEPVAWRCDSGSIANRRVVTVSKVVANSWAEKGMDVSPLYTAPPASVSVPDENGLLPCPCCGGNAEFDYDDDNLNWISCNVCGISTDTAYHTDVDARDKLREIWNRRAAMLQGAEPVTAAYKLPVLTDSQCLEFLAVAFRHVRIKGDVEFDDIRLGLKVALEAAPQQEMR